MAALFRRTSVATKFITGTKVLGAFTNPAKLYSMKLKAVLPPESYTKVKGIRGAEETNIALLRPVFSLVASKGTNIFVRRDFHADVRFPSFDENRQTLDPTIPARNTENMKRALPSAIFYGVGGMITLATLHQLMQRVVRYKWLPADQQALASIQINLDDIPLGENKTYEWRGKPIFVKHRTAEEISREREVSLRDLRHAENDEDRVQKAEWLVVIGVCTHLGCVPRANEGEYHGYFCPCHGSHYDCSGRIRKGPAPSNLEIPAYTFKDDNTIVVG